MSEVEMPSDNISMERYVVYSPDGASDETKSVKSLRSDSITFRDPGYVDTDREKQNSGTTITLTPSSPALTSSTLTSDKWSSYWSKRERCCCFWNFLLLVALAVAVTIVVMAAKGLINLRPSEMTGNASSQNEAEGTDVTSLITSGPCTTTTAEPPKVSIVTLLRCYNNILK